jgi:hypothetical protein
MIVGWIGGWGISPAELRPHAEAHAPGARHVLLAPVAGAAEAAADCDAVVAWSLGARRLLELAARGGRPFPPKVLLLAPFTSFCSEDGACGKVSRTQVRWLRRQLRQDPFAALADFRARAGLPPSPLADELPYAPDLMEEGLDRLEEPAGAGLVTFARRGLPSGWEAYVGDRDPLLDAAGVADALKGCAIVEGAGHALADFLGPAPAPHAL